MATIVLQVAWTVLDHRALDAVGQGYCRPSKPWPTISKPESSD